MKTTLRYTAMAAALVVLSGGAMATPITFDGYFGKPVPADAAPVEVNSAGGFGFSGAWAYQDGMLKETDVLPQIWEPASGGSVTCDDSLGGICNRTGFILNDDRSKNGGVIVVRLGNADTRFFKTVQFDSYTSDQLSVFGFDGKNKWQITQLTPGAKIWSGDENKPAPDVYTVTQQANGYQATELWFDAGSGIAGLDNLRITLTGGGQVPEPASYALVGLALLAAGAAGRRKS